MAVLIALCLALATVGGSSVVAGLLWAVFARAVWGHIAGPPPGLSPPAARTWAQEFARHRASPYPLDWPTIRSSLRQGRWRDVWPLLCIAFGLFLIVAFLPAGVLLNTPLWWLAPAGPTAALALAWTLWRFARR